jgi:hypothetical protein
VSQTTNQTISEPKRRGRPKGSKNKKTLVKEAVSKAPEVTAEVAAEVAKEVTLVSEQPFEGNPAKTDAATHPGQADHLPGTRFPDKLYVPERAYDSDLNMTRQVTLPKEYHYVWVYPDLISSFRGRGYRQVKYNGGSLSGLAERGFKGTDMFENTLDGNVRNGDIILMYIPTRGYEEHAAEERKFIEQRNMAVSTQMHDEGYRSGIRTFEEHDGKEVYN